MATEFTCEKLDDLPAITKTIFDLGKKYNIWILKGEMGTGKTTFIHTLLEQIGSPDHVSSPSYALVNEYLTDEGFLIYHFDLFRLKSLNEALDIGMDEFLESGEYCFIEWPELIEPLLPEKFLEINIRNPETEKRIINLYTHG